MAFISPALRYTGQLIRSVLLPLAFLLTLGSHVICAQSEASYCAGQNLYFSSGCASVSWSIVSIDGSASDYQVHSSNQTLSLTFLVSGRYQIFAYHPMCGSNGGEYDYYQFFVWDAPVIHISPSAQNVNPYQAVVLTASGNGTTYSWYGEGINSATGAQITVFPSQTTTYSVTTTTMGGCSITQSITINVLANPDPYNWTQSTVYGETFSEQGGQVVPGTQVVVGQSRQYSDLHGRPTQSQTRQLTDNKRLVAQALYDSYGVAVGQTLPAPVSSADFNYQTNFITRNGQPYSAAHFDEGKTLTPDAVDTTTVGTLGWYYSNNNTWEPYVDKTDYPYSRTYTAPNGTVTRVAIAGDSHRMGSGRENQAASVPLLNELDAHYLKVRNLYVSTPANASLRYLGTKSVSVDINGREIIGFSDRDGKLLASCRTDAAFAPTTLSGSIEAAGTTNPRYLDIHIPRSSPTTTVTITNSGQTPGQIRIYNEADGSIVYNDGAAANQTLAPGFYRIVSLSGSQTISYPVRYGEFSYQIYDDIGRQLVSIAPRGVDPTVIPATQAAVTFVTTYQTAANGDVLKVSTTDEGSVEYAYRSDGTLRFSQSAQQKLDRKFSYVNYDRMGRALQSGVYLLPSTTNTSLTLEAQLQALWGNDTYKAILENKTRTGGLEAASCRQITDSYYDQAATDLPTAAGTRRQRFLIGAVSKTQNENVTTWYSYDELGQTEWMIQNLAGLGVKIIDYRYDRNGQLREAAFQRDLTAERFSHYYTYDADLRLSQVHTSRDGGTTKMLQAKYLYYQHGPLKRVELATNLQGVDYVYTLQGWLKSINHADAAKDPGKDAVASTSNAAFAPDAFGMTLEYFSGDYTRGATGIAHQEVSGYDSYYSGRIKAISWRTQKPASVSGLDGASMQAYRYDGKYQMTEAVWGSVNLAAAAGTNVFTASTAYGETISGYDAHGNISGLSRTDGAGTVRHNFTAANAYQYTANSNKLSRIPTYALYSYDADGQMTAQQKDVATSPVLNQYVEYDGAGMVVAVYSDAAKTQRKVSYAYDEGGLRVKKVNHVTNITTYYVNGVVYDNEATAGGVIAQKEIPLSGGGRIGIYRALENQYTYELSDHLGNVRAVISGMKVNGRADVLEYLDYYSIGGVARSGGTMRYRYGYQGQYSERDKETEWNSFELRMYDPVIGRWLSPDPYGQFNSPYLAMGNDWAGRVDPDGGWALPPGFGLGFQRMINQLALSGRITLTLPEVIVRGVSNAGAAAAAMSGAANALTGRMSPMLEDLYFQTNAVLHDVSTIPGTPAGQELVPLADAQSEANRISQQKGHRLALMVGVAEVLIGFALDGVGIGGAGPTAGVSLSLSLGGTFLIGHGTTVTMPNALENSFNKRQVNSDGGGGDSNGENTGEGGDYKPLRSNNDANKHAQKLGYQDAHDLKETYVTGNGSKFDIEFNRRLGKTRLVSKNKKIIVEVVERIE